jgi:hypothetical protein
MKTVKFIKTLLIIAAVPVLAGAATKRYIVELSTEPAAKFASRSFGPRHESLARPEVQAQRVKIRGEQDQFSAAIQQLGGQILSRTDTASNTLTVALPEENAAQIATLPGVKNYHLERHYKASLDQASYVHNLPPVYGLIGGASAAGQGIKIGMIDSGIDITQPAFNDTGFKAPAGFPLVNAVSDTKYTNNKVIVARSYVSLLETSGNPDPDPSAADHQGHGTITADCAAGGVTPSVGGTPSFTGIAPGAYLGSYKVFGSSGVYDSPNDAALLKAIDDAVNDGMNVINYSIFTPIPVPPSADQEATALANAFSMGIVVTASIGDEGNGWDPVLQGWTSADGNAAVIPTFASTEGSGSVISVGGSNNQRAFGPSVTIGSNVYLLDTEDAVTTDANGNPLVFTNAPIVDVATIDGTGTGEACNSLPANSLKGAIAFISINGWDPSTDDCDPATKFINAANAGATAAVIYDNAEEDLYDFDSFSYVYSYSFFSGSDGSTPPTNLPGGFVTLDDGNAIKAILAASASSTATLNFNSPYNNVVSWDNIVPLNPQLTFGSTRGPDVSYEIKPDMVAVGSNLLTASETIDPNANYYYGPEGIAFPVVGTSVSAPIVAGAAAILMASHPGLTPAQYRSLLVNSSDPMYDSNNNQARVMDAGAGLLDVNASYYAEAAVVPATLSFGVGTGSTTMNQTLTVTNVSAVADTFNISAVGRDPGFTPSVSPASLQLGPGQSGTVQVSIPGGVLTTGEYEGDIHIDGANTSTDTHVPYWFGIPSTTPYFLTDMGSDTEDVKGQTAKAAIVFRLTDASRIIMENMASQVKVTYTGITTDGQAFATGNGKASAPYALDSYSPGTIAIDVTMDSRGRANAGYYNVFTVSIGSNLSLQFYIYGCTNTSQGCL